MLFRLFHYLRDLRLRPRHHDAVRALAAIRTALSAHRPAALAAVLDTYGARTFARALSKLSERARADAFSMLAPEARARVRAAAPKYGSGDASPHQENLYTYQTEWVRS